MTVALDSRLPVATPWARSLRMVADRLLPAAAPHTVPSVAVRGPGGTGKTLLLAELTAAYRAAGALVVPTEDAPTGSTTTDDLTGNRVGEVAVVVDDGQRLTPDSCRRLQELVLTRRARVTLAYRPGPHVPELTALLDSMGADRQLVVLSHLEPDEVQRWADAELGPAATAELVAFVVQQTGGLPAFVDSLLGALAAGRRGGRPPAVGVPAGGLGRGGAGRARLGEARRALPAP